MIASKNPNSHHLFVPVGIFAITLLWPLAWVAWNGWTLTGVYEESLGYRYFFSLRQVLEPDKFVFLPQGHLPSILHRLIQRFLSYFYEAENLWPRIDMFAYLAILLAHLAAVATFVWAILPIRSQAARILSAVFWAILYYLPGLYGAVQILSPDYHAWMLLIGLFGAGLIIRWAETLEWHLSQSVLLGIYIGVALSLKLTLFVFPATVGLLLLLRTGKYFFKSFYMGSLAIGIGLSVWMLIFLIYNFGDFNFISKFFSYLELFLSSNVEKHQLTYKEFLQQVMGNTSWEVFLIVFSPFLFLASIGYSRSRFQIPVLVALFVGSMIYVEIIFLRFTDATIFEAGVYTIMGFWSLAYIFFRDRRISAHWIFIVGMILVASASLPIILDLPQAMPRQLAQIQENQKAQRELKNILLKTKKPTAFLIPHNAYRLLSIDSAIFKGGGAIYGGEFPDSPFIQRLFADRTYFRGNSEDYREKAIRFLDYGAIIFTIRQSRGENNHLGYYLSQIPERVQELAAYYNSNFQNHNCANWVDFGEQADPRLAVICQQRTIRALDARGMKGVISLSSEKGYWYSLGKEGRKEKLRNGFVTRDDGTIFRLTAVENDVFRFMNVGPWNVLNSQLMGLVGVNHNDQWVLDLEGWNPVNTNHIFTAGSHENPIPGYWISPGEIDATASQLQDQTGSFVRITAHSLSDYMVLNSQAPLPTLTGEPISISAQIRVPRRRDVSLTITDVTNNSGQSTSHQVRAAPLQDEWTSITVRASNVFFPDSGDNYAVGLAHVKPGDYFDIRELSVFIGVLP